MPQTTCPSLRSADTFYQLWCTEFFCNIFEPFGLAVPFPFGNVTNGHCDDGVCWLFKQCSFAAANAQGHCKFFGAAHIDAIGHPLFVIVGDIGNSADFGKHR